MIMQALRTKTRAIMLVVVVVFVVSIFAMYITRGSGPSSRPGAEGDLPVATVDGEKVMASHIDMGVRNYAQQSGQSDLSPEWIVQTRKQVLNSIAMQHMLQKEAARQKITPPREEIDAAVKRIENQFPTKEAFQQYMENSGIKMKDLQEQISMQLSQRMVLDANAGDVDVTEDEALGFYEQTRELFFRQPAGYHVMFARFATLEKAEEARKAVEGGKKWDEVMQDYEGVALDFTLSGEPAFVTEKEFTEGALKEIAGTAIGKVSKAVALDENNVVIVVKQEKIDEKIASYEEASGDIKGMIAQQKRQANQNEYLKGLLTRANIQVLVPEFFEVPAQPEAEGEPVPAEGQEEPEGE
ncbi:MAG TPA: hypothetical protein DCM24_04720 [Synergistaceae bacterium]|nr:hypothetical protein [Synergistaceae bacterium]